MEAHAQLRTIRRSLITAVVAVFVFPLAALAADLYVDCDTGNDNGGANNCQTPATPCLTPNHADSQAGSGDTIYVQGTCTEAGVNAPLIVTTANTTWTSWNSRPVYDAGVNANNYAVWIQGVSSVTVENSYATGADQYGIYIQNASDPIIDSCEIYSNGQSGTYAEVYIDSGSYDVIVQNCIIHDGDYGIRYGGGGIDILHNTIADISSWMIYQDGPATTIDIYNNIIYGSDSMIFDGSRYQLPNSDYNLFHQSGSNFQAGSGPFPPPCIAANLAQWVGICVPAALEANSQEANPQLDGNYHLSSDLSPAIDAADGVHTAPDDFDGEARPLGGGYDQGADERGPEEIPEYSLLTLIIAIGLGLGTFGFIRRRDSRQNH